MVSPYSSCNAFRAVLLGGAVLPFDLVRHEVGAEEQAVLMAGGRAGHPREIGAVVREVVPVRVWWRGRDPAATTPLDSAQTALRC